MNFITVDSVASEVECLNLIRIHSSCCSAGYIDHVTICSLRDLLQCNRKEEVLFLVQLREKIRDIVEDHTGLFGELYFEWCSVTCWSEGSSLQSHFDSNRPYLAHRDYSAILYLNTESRAFTGGLLRFSTNGEEEKVVSPKQGSLTFFSSGPENTHSVSPITCGKRYTMTIWFTKDRTKSLLELPKLSNKHQVQPSLWETPAQRSAMEVKMLADSGGVSCVDDSSFENTAETRRSYGDAVELGDATHTVEALSVVAHSRRIYCFHDVQGSDSKENPLVCLKASDVREVLDFVSFCQFVSGESFVKWCSTKRRDVGDIEGMVARWKQFKLELHTLLEDAIVLWRNDSLELLGGLPGNVDDKLRKLLLTQMQT